VYQRGFDEMGRPKAMEDAGTQTTIVGSATYGPAGELLPMEGVAFRVEMPIGKRHPPEQNVNLRFRIELPLANPFPNCTLCLF
jgi:hypothetical protein